MVKLLPEITTLFVFVLVDTPTDEKPPVLLFATGTEVEDPPKENPLAVGVGAGAEVELVPDAAAGAGVPPNEKPPVDGAAVLFSLFGAGVLPNENPPEAGPCAAGADAVEAPNEKLPVAGAEAPVVGAGAGVDAPPNEKTITKS